MIRQDQGARAHPDHQFDDFRTEGAAREGRARLRFSQEYSLSAGGNVSRRTCRACPGITERRRAMAA